MKVFKKAIDKHLKLMDDARAGNGIDRHLFGLWCAAYDLDLEVPELYTDPLYTRRYLSHIDNRIMEII